MGTWSIQGNNAYIQSSSVTGDNLSVVFKPNSGNTQQGSAQNFTITYNDNGNVTSTQYTLPYCYVPAPEQHEDMFEVNFNTLPQGFEYSNTGDTHTVLVTSGTWSESTQNYVFSPVNISFLNSDGLSFAADSRGSGGGITRSYSVHLSESPENRAVEGIEMKIQQANNPSNYSSQTFDFRAEETPTYYNEIRPYILECTYQMGENQGGSNYFLHFKSYEGENGININKKITFFANSDNYFSTFVNGSNCGGESQQQPQGIGNGPYMNAGEKNTYNCQQAPNSDCISTASERGLFLRFASQECKQQSGFYNNFYLYNDSSGLGTKIDFKNESGDKFLGCKDSPCPIESNSYYDGERGVYLKIPNQREIEFVTGPDIFKRSNVIFNAPNGRTTLSVYEDGAVFVDDAPEGVATVNEHFQNITQFVQQIYPNNSYTSIEACGLFNGVDLGEHCINDIVIEDGELIKRDESLPSSTRAMHIELDNENNN